MATLQTKAEARFTSTANPAHASTFKTILVHVQDDPSFEHRLETALALARPTSAHLSCLHVTPSEAYVASERFGGVFVMGSVIQAIEEQRAELRERIRTKLSREDVSWDYEDVTGDPSFAIISRAALSDLVVTGRRPGRQGFVGSTVQFLGHLLNHSRSPLFIPADNSADVDLAGAAAIAWDGSFEAANAIRASIGMLKLAEAVSVIQVAEGKDERHPRTKMLEYLSRHEIHAELIVPSRREDYWDGEAVADALITSARQVGAGYLVMGAYSHSRVGEYLFGGVTRSLLNSCSIGLVMAH